MTHRRCVIILLFLLGQIAFNSAFFVESVLAGSRDKESATGDRKPCSKKLRPLVIKVGFKDIQRRPKRSFIKKRFVTKPNRYIREMSYGVTCLVGKITSKWYVLPKPLSRYWIPWQNLKVDKKNLRMLVADTLKKVERDFKVSEFDFLIFVLAANAMEWGNQGLNTYPGVLGWKDESQLVTPGGQRIRGGIAIFALSARLGKVFHNIAHILGGVRAGRRVLPDMYDQHLASSSTAKAGDGASQDYRRSQVHMGAWDPMSCNTCAQRPDVPGVSSWTKIRLGWLEDSRIYKFKPGESAEVWLEPLADRSASILALRIPLTPTTYYLVENRQRIGQDRNAPTSGVLVLHSDDAVAEPRFGRAPVRLINANPSIPFLDGAAFDIGKNAAFTDRDNGINIRLIKKKGKSYLVRVELSSPTAKRKIAPNAGSTGSTTKYPFDGNWSVTVASLTGCKNNARRSYPINISQGKIDAPNYRLPMMGKVSENGEFIIQFFNRGGIVWSTQMGSINGQVGKGRFQGKKSSCSGSVKIVRQN